MIDQALLGELVLKAWKNISSLDIVPTNNQAESNPDPNEKTLVAAVQLAGEWQGAVMVNCSLALAATLASHAFDTETANEDDICDAIGEVGNIVAGGVKMLITKQTAISLPTVAEGNSFRFSVGRSELIASLTFTCDSRELRVDVFEARTRAA